MKKVKLAKEWLLVICCLIFGIFVPFIIWLIVTVYGGTPYPGGLLKLYEVFFASLFGYSGPRGDRLLSWCVMLGPYLIIQLIRSILWSIKTIKKNK